MMRPTIFLAAIAALPASASAQALPADPLDSPMWQYHAERLFAGMPVSFDERVKIEMPIIAENQHAFPVAIDARALPGARRIVLFADLNPIPVALDYRPLAAEPFIATRIKLDQATPVRAAVQLEDGSWHLAGKWIDASGGGCSAPPVSRVRGDWAEHLGEIRGSGWHEGSETRLRISFRHPMDTGLVENIPAYNIDNVTVSRADGTPLARMHVFGSVAEDPAFTVIVDDPARTAFSVSARDTGGLEFSGSLAPATRPVMASLHP
ncbi:quinoprotein dehydrogenase-associated SoxYZ-like carrier [Novosphingobium mangrovi (ex Huang et al. 2023)]|uniref:Quinoprotein dehydrogenase-associated SoxYZ-like carrier n=1 Tax=Novosphingobium mangrovi (ex Huang et al. 2023) TaxID=2976432 RepID=A0ABT2I2C3_9SPHN|nr:quinoprotein dehydrogenase-associated SoxYZ-like carrier [Novosphingobium mangrovi (ex Huang et al. 2023)]MCT2398757.1 quinoprotein dehydrogenase-associated SoxYZ-like carrier [Novosphingobium mangrovi (ex Huang et al. 2023)]